MEIYRSGRNLHKIDGKVHEHHVITGSGRVVHRYTRTDEGLKDEALEKFKVSLEQLKTGKVDSVKTAIKAYQKERVTYQKERVT